MALLTPPSGFAAGRKPPPEDRPVKTSDKQVAGSATEVLPADAEYKIGIEDVLLISVWRDTDLTREVPVRPDGKISLPLIHDIAARSEEHTSELQSLRHLVCRLLLEKKKK